jgi:hypothetical protein
MRTQPLIFSLVLGLAACTGPGGDPKTTGSAGEEAAPATSKDPVTGTGTVTGAGSVAPAELVPPNFAAGVTDDRSIPETRVTLPPAGSSFIDPDFHTKIIRLTHARDLGAQSCVHSYSTVPAFNVDSTRVLVSCGGEARLYTFDKATDRPSPAGTLTDGQAVTVNWESAFWSGVSPSILYVLGGASGERLTKLYRVDVTRHDASRFTVMHDFAGAWRGTWNLWQLSRSEDDKVFTFHARDAAGRYYKTGAYLHTRDQLVTFPDGNFDVDETYVEKGGRTINVTGKGGQEFTVKVWDPWTNTVVATITDTAENKMGGHYDLGATYWVNGDRYQTGELVRTWTGLTAPRNVFQYKMPGAGGPNWGVADHVSMRNADESFFLVSTYGGAAASWPAFQREIVLVKTNGSGFSRVAHTRSAGVADPYWSQPRAVIDRSGHYVVFTSDHGTSQNDVYILKLP